MLIAILYIWKRGSSSKQRQKWGCSVTMVTIYVMTKKQPQNVKNNLIIIFWHHFQRNVISMFVSILVCKLFPRARLIQDSWILIFGNDLIFKWVFWLWTTGWILTTSFSVIFVRSWAIDSNKNIAENVEIPQLLRVDNLSVIEIVVQIQIRLGNSARTVALRRATAKLQIFSY